jgi:Xaa-Pro aminopeptidase
LPKARFEDISAEMAEIMLVKTPAELRLVEKAAEIGERAHEVMLSVAKPGVTEREIRSKMAESILHDGASIGVALLEMGPGILKKGDVINSEWGPAVGGLEAQVTLCVSVGRVSEKTEKLAEIAEACLKKGLASLKPEVRFGRVMEAMEKVVADAGAWHHIPLLHSLNPTVLRGTEGTLPKGAKPLPGPSEAANPMFAVLGSEVVVKSGMTFTFEPCACLGDDPSQVKIGGTAIVTDTGVRMLNVLGTKMQRI